MCKKVDVLLGSRKTRFGGMPSTEQYATLERLVDNYVSKDRPIHLITMWGGLKGYGQFGKLDVDLADVSALLQFKELNSSLKCAYAPGLRVTIIREDLTELLFTPQFAKNCEPYERSFRELVEALGLDKYIHVVNESDLIEDVDDYVDTVQWFATNMAAYYYKDEFEANDPLLTSLGWKGHLSRQVWMDYQERAKAEWPDHPIAKHTEAVALYFGNTLARTHHKVLPKDTIKASFAPFPESVSQNVRFGRIEYKVRPSKNSHKCVAPWAGFSVVKEDGSWTLTGVREFRAMSATASIQQIPVHQDCKVSSYAVHESSHR